LQTASYAPVVVRVREGAVTWRAADDEVIVLDLDSSTYLALNTTAAYMWPLLISGIGEDELVASVVREFDVDQTAAASDVDVFLTALRSRGLLEH
jgi:Coenzyme PQQ synthesis protein D (PqqD)